MVTGLIIGSTTSILIITISCKVSFKGESSTDKTTLSSLNSHSRAVFQDLAFRLLGCVSRSLMTLPTAIKLMPYIGVQFCTMASSSDLRDVTVRVKFSELLLRVLARQFRLWGNILFFAVSG